MNFRKSEECQWKRGLGGVQRVCNIVKKEDEEGRAPPYQSFTSLSQPYPTSIYDEQLTFPATVTPSGDRGWGIAKENGDQARIDIIGLHRTLFGYKFLLGEFYRNLIALVISKDIGWSKRGKEEVFSAIKPNTPASVWIAWVPRSFRTLREM